MPKPTTLILLTAFFLAVGVGGFWAGTKFLNSRTEEPSSLRTASEQVENSLPPENAPAIRTEMVEVIAPSIGPLARYQELGKAEFYKKNTVSFKLKKDDAKELAVGQNVYLVGSDNEIAPLQAKIHRIASGQKRDEIIVTLTEENPDPELLKYKYEAYSATHDEMNVRRIPRSALWTDATGTPFVWKVWQNEQGQMTVGKVPANILFESGDLIAISQQTARTDHILLLAPPKDLQDGDIIESIHLNEFLVPLRSAEQQLEDAHLRDAYARQQAKVMDIRRQNGTDTCHQKVNRYGVPYSQLPGGDPGPAKVQNKGAAASSGNSCSGG